MNNKEVVIQARVSAPLEHMIRESAAQAGVTPSQLIRRAIGAYLIGDGVVTAEKLCDRPHRRMADCHPTRVHAARGMCRNCYDAARKS